ncbi:MAG: hypothetical protein Q8L92_01945, partial [Rubrivivax sp.]|nr:hypothetical protein [Rubrivivax sp.]
PAASQPFGLLLAQLARTRAISAGSIVGSSLLRPAASEAAADLQPDDSVCIELAGADGQSLFGAIEQRVTRPA